MIRVDRRQIYGGVGLGVAVVALANILALSNVCNTSADLLRLRAPR